MNPTHVLDIVLHITIIISALSVLFWVVISKEEDKSSTNMIKNVVSENLKKVKDKDGNDDQDSATNQLIDAIGCNSGYANAIHQTPSYTDTQNEWVKRTNKLYVGALVILFVTLVLYTVYVCKQGKSINVSEIVFANVGTLVVVAGFEYYFFKNIASKYVPVVPSFAEQRFLNTVTSGVPTSTTKPASSV